MLISKEEIRQAASVKETEEDLKNDVVVRVVVGFGKELSGYAFNVKKPLQTATHPVATPRRGLTPGGN
jgi:hypothetical protein